MATRAQLLKAVDEALELQVIKLVAVLMVAPQEDEMAWGRFKKGLDKSVDIHSELVEIVTDMTEGEEESEPWLNK